MANRLSSIIISALLLAPAATFATDWGYCDTESWGVSCEYNGSEDRHFLIGMNPAQDRIILCYYENFDYFLYGYADIGGTSFMQMQGSNTADDTIEVIAEATNFGHGCNFGNYADSFLLTTLFGRGGTDTILGGPHRDYIYAEYVQGLHGDDIIYLQNNSGVDYTVAYGGYGTDQIHGTNGVDVIWGDNNSWSTSGSSDFIYGKGGGDLIYGGGGIDRIDGNSGADYLYGGSGPDTIQGGNDRDRIWGGTGDDSLTGGSGWDIIYGEDGDDYISGNGDADDLYGGNGNDTLYGQGADDCNGGGGSSDQCIECVTNPGCE